MDVEAAGDQIGNRGRPRGQSLNAVLRPPQPQIRMRPRRPVDEARFVVLVRGAPGRVGVRQQRSNLVRVPGRVTKLEGYTDAGWDHVEQRGQAFEVGGEVRRCLKQDRAEPVAQNARRRHEPLHGLGAVAEAQLVGDPPRRLQRKREARRGLGCPPGEQRFGGEPVEGVVDLDPGQPGGVRGQEPGPLHPLGVEAALPLVVGEARGSDESTTAHRRRI